MWKDATGSTKGYLVAQLFLLVGLTGGAINHTINGTWDMLTLSGGAIYILGSGMVSSTGVILFSKWALSREERRSRRVAEISWKRAQHHLGADPVTVDKHGYRTELDWQFVAILEDELGYTHTDEAYCRGNACWVENQHPEYAMENGFLAIASFPKLPEWKGSEDSLNFDDNGMLIQPDPDIIEDKKQSNRLKNELQARRARGTGYIPASITANEARQMGYRETEIKEMSDEDKWRQSAAKVDETLEQLRSIPE